MTQVQDEPVRVIQRYVGTTLAGVAEIRAWIRGPLAEHDVPEPYSSRLVLLASELTANAIQHAAAPVRVDLAITSDALTVTVVDHAPEVELPPRGDRCEAQGRGLDLVARIASAWGTRADVTTKAVWCTVDLTPTDPGDSPHARD